MLRSTDSYSSVASGSHGVPQSVMFTLTGELRVIIMLHLLTGIEDGGGEQCAVLENETP